MIQKTTTDTNDQKFTDLIKGKVVKSFIMDRYTGAIEFTDGSAIGFQCHGANVCLEAEFSLNQNRYDESNIVLRSGI